MSQSQYYVTHYFNAQNAGSFMAVSLIGLIVVLAIVLLTAKLQKHYKINIENPTEVELAQIEQTHKTKVISWIESFYEMVFSSTSVLIFLSLYYVLDERIPQAAYFWNKYQDILLMVFLVCSVFLTFWFDRIFVHLKTISSEQKASVRLISAFFSFFDHFDYFLSTLFSNCYFIYFGSFPSISTYILSITCFLSNRSSFYVFQIKIKKYYTDLFSFPCGFLCGNRRCISA